MKHDILFDVAAAAALDKRSKKPRHIGVLKSTPTMLEIISGTFPKEILDILVDVASRASEAVGQQNQTFPVYLNE